MTPPIISFSSPQARLRSRPRAMMVRTSSSLTPSLVRPLLPIIRRHALPDASSSQTSERRDLRQEHHGRRDPNRPSARGRPAPAASHQLADDQRQIGDGHDDEADAERFGDVLGQSPLQKPADRRAPSVAPEKGARQDADERYAVCTVERSGQGSRPEPGRAALLRPAGRLALEPRGPGGDNRQFGHGGKTSDDGQDREQSRSRDTIGAQTRARNRCRAASMFPLACGRR